MNSFLNKNFFFIAVLSTIILFLSSNYIIQKININLGIDFTSTRTFSLSDGTKRVINEIEEPLKICFIYSRNLSKNIPIIQNYANQVQGLLNRYSDLANKTEIESLITSETKKVNNTLPDKQRIKKFVLLYKEFDADDDELTRTKKLRRNFVIKKYSDIVEALYGDKKTIDINTSVKLQDGGVQKINTKLNIINMENINGI